MNKKKFIILIGSLIVVFGVVLTILLVKGSTQEGSSNTNEYGEEHKRYANTFNLELVKENNDQYYVITGLTTLGSNEESLIIPDTIDEIKVKKLLSNKDFSDYRLTEYVEIGKNLEYIGTVDDNTTETKIFINAINLKGINVDLNNSVYASIDGVLYNKDKTILLKYPNNANLDEDFSVTIRSGVKTIYNDAFVNNQKIERVIFNDSLAVIKENAFKNCQHLKQIDFSTATNLKEIGAFAFYKCTSLTKVLLPEGLKTIGNNAFANCNNAQTQNFVELYVPSTIISFGSNICYNTSNVDSFVLTTLVSNIENLKNNCEKFNISQNEITKKIKIYK